MAHGPCPMATTTTTGSGAVEVDNDPVTVSETSECAVQSRRKRRFCPHCKEEVATKTFKFHKRLYYDKV